MKNNEITKEIKEILNGDDNELKRALFSFHYKEKDEKILFKFNLWAKYNFPEYFTSDDAEFHKNIDLYNLHTYKGRLNSFVDIAFRGASKTSRTKLFITFCILNDRKHYRKYIKVLSADINNSRQITTDIYNQIIRLKKIYPETFKKTGLKREETMTSFTTSFDVKVLADTVGTDQRGALQGEARPDWIIFEDFETRKTLRSAVLTQSIWDNMEEARTSLSKEGSCIYNCNYLSERGNVHKLVIKGNDERNRVLIIPIIEGEEPTWKARYTLEDIEQMKKDDDDFEGERLCKPSAGKDIMFSREKLEEQKAKKPIENIAGFKIFDKYRPGERYASGHDVAGGVGLDSSTSVFIDFSTIPAKVVATYKNNEIKPDVFGYEINNQANLYGKSLVAVEKNNHGHTTIAILKQLEANQYITQSKDTKIDESKPKEYGWQTNALTKPKMLYDLKTAIDKGLLELTDQDLINEAKSYTRDDLMDKEIDPRLSTRHFDLLIACAIAWQMKDEIVNPLEEIDLSILEESEPIHKRIGI